MAFEAKISDAGGSKSRRRGRPRYDEKEVVMGLGQLLKANPTISANKAHEFLREAFPERAPFDIRTTRNLIKEIGWVDRSPTWSPGTADPTEVPTADVPLVLEAHAAAMLALGEHGWPLTTAQARWIAFIRRNAPDLTPFEAYTLANDYRRRADLGGPTHELDLAVTLHAWRSDTDFAAFAGIRRRLVATAPSFPVEDGASLMFSLHLATMRVNRTFGEKSVDFAGKRKHLEMLFDQLETAPLPPEAAELEESHRRFMDDPNVRREMMSQFGLS